ncbi:MAG: flagellar export chaperone FliS [Lachnospiraceae bacterium]|jgi:flagellar protein FliS|nr:flagellar export chaperone FliS [Lachnospiraceae bacterium]
MLKQNGYAQYQNAKIMTASPAELTLMLYDGAIKFGNIAILAMENKDPGKAHENIVKVEKIVQNFRDTLDKKYAVAQDFENVYVYLLRRCHEANIAKDPEIMEEVLKHLRSMRDNWKEVMKKVAGDKTNPTAQARVAGGQGNTTSYKKTATY